MKNNYEKLYAICIYYLIKDSLDMFDVLVVCNDEKYFNVKKWLDVFFEGDVNYWNKEVTSISYFRKIMDDKNLRSCADKLANIYRTKGAKIDARKQRGIFLNMVDLSVKNILDLLKK